MLKKEIKKENETQSENFIYQCVTLHQHHTLISDLIILKDSGCWSGGTYLAKKGYLVLPEPPFKIKS